MVFKYWSLWLFISLICISPMYAVDTEAAVNTNGVHIEYEGEVLSKVRYTSSGVTTIIPHVVLTDLLTDDEKKLFKDFEQTLSEWKWYMKVQSLCVAFAGYLTIQNYIDGNIAHRLRNTKLVCLVANAYRYVPVLKWGALLNVCASTIYPIYRFDQLFTVGQLEDTYPTEVVDEKILIIRRKTFSHAEAYGALILYYFNYSEPLGYILIDQKDEFFKQVRQARTAVNATLMAQTMLGALGSWWIISSL